jgi:hypothetical protein
LNAQSVHISNGKSHKQKYKTERHLQNATWIGWLNVWQAPQVLKFHKINQDLHSGKFQ